MFDDFAEDVDEFNCLLKEESSFCGHGESASRNPSWR